MILVWDFFLLYSHDRSRLTGVVIETIAASLLRLNRAIFGENRRAVRLLFVSFYSLVIRWQLHVLGTWVSSLTVTSIIWHSIHLVWDVVFKAFSRKFTNHLLQSWSLRSIIIGNLFISLYCWLPSWTWAFRQCTSMFIYSESAGVHWIVLLIWRIVGRIGWSEQLLVQFLVLF